jgi:hypothetical protein
LFLFKGNRIISVFLLFESKTKVRGKFLCSFDEVGGFSLGLMKAAAVKGLIPAGNKVGELRSNLLRLITETSVVLDERFGPAGLEAVSEIFQRLGEEDAKTMKERLGFGNTLKDALDAWLVIGHIMGSKMEPNWVSENRVEVSHSYCPQHEEFLKRGNLYCTAACLPYVGAIAQDIGKGVKMDVVRAADENAPCIKALSVPTEEIE